MPAVGNFILDKGRVPEAAITRYRAVKAGAGEESVIPTAAIADLIEGVAMEAVTANEILQGKHLQVRTQGIVPWECSAAIAKGALVTIVADGRCKTAAATERVHGRNVGNATTLAGQLATIELARNGHIQA